MSDLLKLLDEIDAMEKQATPGEWSVSNTGAIKNDIGQYILHGTSNRKESDILYLVTLGNNWPRISAALRDVISDIEHSALCEVYKDLEDKKASCFACWWLEKHSGGE